MIPPPKPKLTFDIIYCDPPWRYDTKIAGNRSIEDKYCTMSVDEIKGLNVPSSDNSILFLWATSPLLEYALDVSKAWGFKYKSQLIWDKKLLGMGFWFRVQHEILIVSTKGKVSPPIPKNRISSIFQSKRGQHSSKPDYIREWISSSFPGKTKLEMFYRSSSDMWPRPDGWSVWGSEIKDFEILSK